MSDTIKFAVVGCGHIGKRHAEMITRNAEAKLVALCDIKDKEDLGLEKYDQAYYKDLGTLLEKHKDIDAVAICTPNGLHAEQSIQVLQAGIHVVCEKPMGLSRKNCQDVIELALNNSKQVFCVMQNRYSPPSIWLKEMIDEKRLGDIYTVNIDCFWNRDSRYYKKDHWKGTNKLDGGTLFTQFSSVWDTNLESSITVIGEKGSIKIGGQYMNEVSYCHVKDYEMPILAPSNKANDYGHYKGSAANHGYVIDNVVDTLKKRTVATTNAMEGMKVVEIIERIYEVRNNQK